MKERLAKLIDVKTITTFAIVGTICYLGIVGKISPENMFQLALIIIGFYYGTQKEKKSEVQ